MGFPDIQEVLNEKEFEKKAKLVACFLAGPVLFFVLLNLLTAPVLFSNDVYYKYLLV